MRILGIDPGERRIGLAVSDELGVTAQGLETFDKKDGGDFLSYAAEIIGHYGIGEIVVGDPVPLSGRPGRASARARQLARDLQERFGVKVAMWDERLTSKQARQTLKGARAKKTAVDKLAAVIILQDYLDWRRRDEKGNDPSSG